MRRFNAASIHPSIIPLPFAISSQFRFSECQLVMRLGRDGGEPPHLRTRVKTDGPGASGGGRSANEHV